MAFKATKKGADRKRKRRKEKQRKGSKGKLMKRRERRGGALPLATYKILRYAHPVSCIIVLHTSACLCTMVWKFPGSDKPFQIPNCENCLESTAVKIKPLQILVKFYNCRHISQPVTILI